MKDSKYHAAFADISGILKKHKVPGSIVVLAKSRNFNHVLFQMEMKPGTDRLKGLKGLIAGAARLGRIAQEVLDQETKNAV